MGRETGISWTDATWNPVRGCSRVSQGCVNCYAEVVAGRFCGPGQPYEGLAVRRLKTLGEDDETSRIESRWTGEVRLIEKHLEDPLRWRKPKRIFVNSMSDLFHEKLANRDIARIFTVMANAKQHTFQVLTKRPERMLAWFEWLRDAEPTSGAWLDALDATKQWPLPNVHLGVSVEDQATADERIPLLLQTPAATRFVSYEPALGPVDFGQWIGLTCTHEDAEVESDTNAVVCRRCDFATHLDWIIVGGESGPRARPFYVQWAWDTVAACKRAGVACFVKQLGSRPFGQFGPAFDCITGKGDDPDEWPEGLRVQQFPEEVRDGAR